MNTSAPTIISARVPVRRSRLVTSAMAACASLSSGISFTHRAKRIAQGDVPEPGGQQQLGDGDGRRARAGEHHLHVLLLLPHHPQGVGEAGQGDDGRAVLVVVEHRDIAHLLQPALDLKAAGGGDVLQVDAAEGAGDVVHRLNELVHILGPDTQGERVDAAEGLEQDALALHHRHPGLGADVPQAQHGGAVGDDRHQVVPPGELVALARGPSGSPGRAGPPRGCRPPTAPPCSPRAPWPPPRSFPSTPDAAGGPLSRNP